MQTCPRGTFTYNDTFCLPCIPGYKCGSEWRGPIPCEPHHWSDLGAYKCLPCGLCDGPRQVVVTPCASVVDTACRYCPLGFMAENRTHCRLPPMHMDPVVVLSFTMVVVLAIEMLLCAFSWCTYRKYRLIPS